MKENLVIQSDRGGDVTTSLLVAEVFGKEHAKVVRDIESLSCSDDFRFANFGVSFILRDLPNGGSRKDRYYEITKDGFSFLVMGYTGAKAAQFKEMFIAEFNRHEAMLKSDDYILMRSQQILKKRLDMAEQKVQKLQSENAATWPANPVFSATRAFLQENLLTLPLLNISATATSGCY